MSRSVSGADARLGGALLLDGANVFGTMPKNSNLDINTNQVTVSLWVKSELVGSINILPANPHQQFTESDLHFLFDFGQSAAPSRHQLRIPGSS